MKHPVLTILGSIAAGSISAYGSMFIATQIYKNMKAEEKKKEDEAHRTLLNKINSILTGTCSENLIDKYIDVVNKSREMFPNDYNRIIEILNNTINNDVKTEDEYYFKIEALISALDILHDAMLTTEE